MKIPAYLILLCLLASCSSDDRSTSSENASSIENANIGEQSTGEGSEGTEQGETPLNKLSRHNYLFTEQAKQTLKQRFAAEYTGGVGFTSDFKRIEDSLLGFLAYPSEHRPEFGASGNIPSDGRVLHMAALYAYAMDDVGVANTVADELLGTINSNDLSDDFWSMGYNFSNQYSLFIQTAKAKKLKDSYYLISLVQNSFSESEKDTIESWFSDYKDLVQAWMVPRLSQYLGANWENIGITTAKPEGLYPGGVADPYPLKYSNGSDMTDYGVSWFQDHFNNRMLDNVAYLHSWAVYNSDTELEHYTRAFFKAVIKYGTWSDGTYWEVIRNKPTDNTLGVFYSNVSLTALVAMAHLDAQADHYPDDRLYDFATSEGIVNGSTNLTQSPYLGGSTTDGVTQKSLKSIIVAQSKYVRNSTNGGWYDLRYNNGAAMTTVNKRQNSVLAAVANLYYKDPSLKNYYLYNTAAGYPSKVAIYEGWGVVEDDGAWGNLIVGGAWLEQENNFFD